MTKAQILQEIKTHAEANNGIPLGLNKFENETGIKQWDWQKFWPRWNDAVREAGYTGNQLTAAYDENELMDKFAKLAQELGRLPVRGDLHVKAHADKEFPSAPTFRKRLGGKLELIKRLTDF